MKFILGITLGSLLVSSLSFATPPPETKEQAEVRKWLQENRPTAEQAERFKKIQEYQEYQKQEREALARLLDLTEGRLDEAGLLTVCANDVAELLKNDVEQPENDAEKRKNNRKLTVDEAKKKVLACRLAEKNVPAKKKAATKKEAGTPMQTTGGSSVGGSEGVGAP